MNVLVVDDEPDVRTMVRRALDREGFATIEAGTAADAEVRLAAGGIDVVVLDLHLPDTTGMEALTRIRAVDPAAYVLILTGARAEADRVLALVSGADDYVVKPFSPRELAARLLAVARRHGAEPSAVLRYGDLLIDRAARTVRLDDREVELPRRELDLLIHLAAHPGRTFSREELLHAVWGSSAAWQQAATVTEHVRRLRAKIERDPNDPQRVVTVRGSGYRFSPPGSGTVAASAPLATEGARSAATVDATVVITGTTIRFASPSMVTLLGARDATEIIARDVFDFVAPQSVGATRARHEQARQGTWPRPEVITLQRIDGREVLVEIASAPVLWDGEPASQVTIWELAATNLAVQELATGISTDVTDAVVVTGEDLRIQCFNEAARALYGWDRDDVIGRSLLETIGWEPVSEEADTTRARLFGEGHWHGESVQRRRDGTRVRVRSSTTVLRDASGRTVGVISVNRPVGISAVTWTAAPVSDPGLDRAIRTGIERGEFVVHYQPVVGLASGELRGVEALVRWQHPDRGLLAPAHFIGAAEQSGAIGELGFAVLEQACRDVQRWRGRGADLHLAVNLSGRQLADPAFPDLLAALMSATDTPRGRLWLEVTETALVQDLEQAVDSLQRVDDIGACLSIDDFGTGWASLTYLREFPVHALKIDRSFVAGLGTASRDEAIVRSMLSLGRELDVAVVAEGVETEAQRAHLVALGCSIGQGFLLGRPHPPTAIEAILSLAP